MRNVQRVVGGIGALMAMMVAACSQGTSTPAIDNADVATNVQDDAGSTDTATKKLPIRPFQASFVPPAAGAGNFEICLSREAKENGIAHVTIPAASIFQSWGALTGDLRDSRSFDMNTVSGEKDPGTEYAVVLVNPVSLSNSQPCAIAAAHAVTHDGFSFIHDIVPAELHLTFQADGLSETPAADISNEDPADTTLRDAYSDGFINGTPIADIGQVRRLRERDD